MSFVLAFFILEVPINYCVFVQGEEKVIGIGQNADGAESERRRKPGSHKNNIQTRLRQHPTKENEELESVF